MKLKFSDLYDNYLHVISLVCTSIMWGLFVLSALEQGYRWWFEYLLFGRATLGIVALSLAAYLIARPQKNHTAVYFAVCGGFQSSLAVLEPPDQINFYEYIAYFVLFSGLSYTGTFLNWALRFGPFFATFLVTPLFFKDLGVESIGEGVFQFTTTIVILATVVFSIRLNSEKFKVILKNIELKNRLSEEEGRRHRVVQIELSKVRDELVRLTEDKTVSEIAKKVAHDIRSPLTALNMLVSASDELGENKRRMLSAASQRINSIADEMLDYAKKGLVKQKELELEMIDFEVSRVVREKNIEHLDKQVTIEHFVDYGVFSKVHSSGFARILSNLVNNSVEAGAKNISICASKKEEVSVVEIRDDGCGISEENLKKIGKSQFTTKNTGHGIGLSSAIASLETWGGQVHVDSELGNGTKIVITLPAQNPPSWFLPELHLDAYEGIVVIDDDPTVHLLFDSKFRSTKVVHFPSIKRFEESAGQFTNWLKIVDNDLGPKEQKGFDFSRVTPNSILMSGDFSEDLKIKIRGSELKFLPKECLETVAVVPRTPGIVESQFLQ